MHHAYPAPGRAQQSANLLCRRGCAALLLAIAATDASAHPPPGTATIVLFGMIPTLLLLFAYVISLFRSRAPWAHQLCMGLGLAASLMLTLVLAGNNTLHLPYYAVPLIWIVPALAWWALSRWFRRHRAR
ncbi:UNVERIFIED_ORG: hypothetical protein JN05_05000 [Zoogloea ramigera]|uniref:Transmembrane protein n=1 Tax=Duganella zoogloeoides TaxID=75659 RepID=A0ABZ0Y0Z5_9BURK|nr:hypothetical protein [Duganella zoogloeoides]WQH05147.1 hypothetical protein SR858_02125 [Duganella zoogloeoides]